VTRAQFDLACRAELHPEDLDDDEIRTLARALVAAHRAQAPSDPRVADSFREAVRSVQAAADSIRHLGVALNGKVVP
jgi:hypothetical protein